MDLSVLISSYRRPEVLARTLEHLARQDPDPGFDVVVAIDGDADHGPARLEEFRERAPFDLTVLRFPHLGHGAVLNRGLEAVRGTYCLILGDDIFPTPEWIHHHLSRLREFNRPEVAVQGLTRWHPDLFPDAFLEWELESGAIFAYPRMQPRSFVSPEFLFTSNVSFTTRWLRSTPGFPEDVPWNMDTLFAFRARAQGLRLFYEPRALAHHFHRWSMHTEVSRRYTQGRLAARLEAGEPEFSGFITHPRLTPWRRLRHAASRLARPAAERFGPRSLRGWCWMHELNYQFARGYRDQQAGREDRHSFEPME